MNLKLIISKYDRLSVAAKASLWFIFCYVIQRGLQLIGLPIFTRVMSTEEYGTYSVFLSWFNLLCVFTSLNIYSGAFNKAMVKFSQSKDCYISSIQWMTLFLSFIFSIIVICFNDFFSELTGYSLKFQLLMCLHLLLFPSLQYWSQKQRFLFEYKKLVIVTLVNSFSSLFFGVIFVFLSEDKSFALISVTVFVQAIINFVLFFSNVEKNSSIFNKQYWSWSLIIALPLIPHYLSEILLGHADRIMISQICGSSQAGIYNLVYQLSMVMTVIRSGINGAFVPWLYNSLNSKDYKKIKDVSNIITFVMFFFTFIFMLIGPELLMLVAPPSYSSAKMGIPAIMIGCFFIYVYVLFMYVEIFFEKTRGVAIASIIAAVINILLNSIFIEKYGYLSAAYTTMFSYMLMSFIHFIFLKKILSNNSEVKIMYDIRLLVVMSIILLIIGGLSVYLYRITLLRWMIIIILGIIALKYKERIMSIYILLRKNN